MAGEGLGLALADLENGPSAHAAAAARPLPGTIGEWTPYLERLGVPSDLAPLLAERAAASGTTILAELAAAGLVSEQQQYRALAETLGIAFLETIDPDDLVLSEERCLTLLGNPERGQVVKLAEPTISTVVVAPRRLDLGWMREFLAWLPAVRQHLRMASPGGLRRALIARTSGHLARHARMHLFETHPDMSARTVAKAWQGAFLASVALALPMGFALAPEAAFAAVHIVASLFFLACVLLRLCAIPTAERPGPLRFDRVAAADVPVYSVLVALYREAEIVPQLLAALGRLAWPRSKLEIKIVCEADDEATLAALEAQPLRPWVEIVRVPPGAPRTKPKALCHALPLTSGRYVALYDAEDRPHPMQLVDAWTRFQSCADDVASVQAPLVVTNGHDSAIARAFAFEYAALFRGLLPWLSARRLLLPLGGTSNHFRRDVLDAVGAWDPYNVTEDADLAVRLSRFGYRSETIACPTAEDCVTGWSTWLPQRTRWYKGWATTWLVHMRNPARTVRDMGWGSFLIMQMIFAGAICSTLVHPLFVATMAWAFARLVLGHGVGTFHSAMLLIDAANISLGYLSFWLLGWKTLYPRERRGFWKVMLFTPVYWTMMSVAVWRAIAQLIVRPHHWEKTPHLPRRAGVRSAGLSSAG